MENKFIKIRLALGIVLMSAASFAYAGTEAGPGCLIAGPSNAAVTIEEFSDFECPYCEHGASTMKEVLKNYSGKVNLVLRNRPLPFHKHALAAAKAFTAVCMQSPSLANDFQNELFHHQDELGKDGDKFIFSTAQKLGVDVSQMKSDMNSQAVAKSIADDEQLAKDHKFGGTPSFMIGSEPVVGALPYEEIKKVIDRQLGY